MDDNETRLERSVLGKRISRQSPALRALGDFDADCGSVGRGDASWTQHGKLRKDFVVDLGNQIILPIRVAAPNLPELDEMRRHNIFL